MVVEANDTPTLTVREGAPSVRGLTLPVVANDAGRRGDVPAGKREVPWSMTTEKGGLSGAW